MNTGCTCKVRKLKVKVPGQGTACGWAQVGGRGRGEAAETGSDHRSL